MDEQIPDNQIKNTSEKPWLWKKGQSGNLRGRPKGKTMKEWAKEYLACMNDEERDEFMAGIPKEIIWRMAEGNPKQDNSVEVGGELTIRWQHDNDTLQTKSPDGGVSQL